MRLSLVALIMEYFSRNPDSELSALEILQKARLSTMIGKPLKLSELRSVLDGAVEMSELKLRKAGGMRLYSRT